MRLQWQQWLYIYLRVIRCRYGGLIVAAVPRKSVLFPPPQKENVTCVGAWMSNLSSFISPIEKNMNRSTVIDANEKKITLLRSFRCSSTTGIINVGSCVVHLWCDKCKLHVLSYGKTALSGPQLLANVLVQKEEEGVGENHSDKHEILKICLIVSFFILLLTVLLIRYGFRVR
jgi:hypothetical protein